jgi:hypothetical protein
MTEEIQAGFFCLLFFLKFVVVFVPPQKKLLKLLLFEFRMDLFIFEIYSPLLYY